jgi:hypothetical protein
MHELRKIAKSNKCKLQAIYLERTPSATDLLEARTVSAVHSDNLDELKKTPYHELYGRSPRLDHLRVFGCKAYYLMPKEKRLLTATPGRQFPGHFARFVGYDAPSHSYLLYDGSSERILRSRDVSFVETEFRFSYQNWTDADQEFAWVDVEAEKPDVPSVAPLSLPPLDRATTPEQLF